jgi:F-type H+-transporting ATPase subunit b
MYEAEFWVLISFLIFAGIVLYLKVPALLGRALDARAARIAKELEEARKLREEAQALLAEYQGKQREAAKLAEDIVAQARRDAEAEAAEARRKLAEMVERRSKMAEQKIAQAEAQALKEVRAAAAELAIAAATRIIAERAKGPEGARLVDQSIAQIKSRLH